MANPTTRLEDSDDHQVRRPTQARSPTAPPRIDVDVISEFDHRKVQATGHFRHDQEMLLGPRIHDGENGYIIFTPLERGEGESSVLISRGWISKKLVKQADRREGLPEGEVVVEGLLREPWKKNMFTPDNRPDRGEFYFPDVKQMAELSGCQPVCVEETMGMFSIILDWGMILLIGETCVLSQVGIE